LDEGGFSIPNPQPRADTSLTDRAVPLAVSNGLERAMNSVWIKPRDIAASVHSHPYPSIAFRIVRLEA
jgi:hypothetical protein